MTTQNEIEYPENCEECGSPILIEHNDSDIEFWCTCEDCGHIMQVKLK